LSVFEHAVGVPDLVPLERQGKASGQFIMNTNLHIGHLPATTLDGSKPPKEDLEVSPGVDQTAFFAEAEKDTLDRKSK